MTPMHRARVRLVALASQSAAGLRFGVVLAVVLGGGGHR